MAGWIPPELEARSKAAAERDIATAAKLAERQKKRKREPLGAPEPRNPRFAFAVSGLCVLFLLAGRAAGFAGPRGGFDIAAILDWVSFALTLLLYLKFMLPVLKKPHRVILIALLAGRLASDIAFAALTALAEPARGALPTLALAVFVYSPLLLLLYGLLRRRSTEKGAGLLQILVVLVLLLALIGAFSLRNVFRLSQAVCLVFLLINWPVLSRPASWEKESAVPQ